MLDFKDGIYISERRVSMPVLPSPQQNHLLAALSAEVQRRLFSYLELVLMPLLGKVLYESV